MTKKKKWFGEDTAPKDGTMLHLLVKPDRDSFTSFKDSLSVYETIGFNSKDATGEDEWKFAGWDWIQDEFTTGHGRVIGWLPFGAKGEDE